MKFTCNGNDLAAAFAKVVKAVSPKKGIPILEGVKISADGDVITLVATDTEMTIINKIRGHVMLEGDMVIEGKIAHELVAKMGANTIEVDCLDGNNNAQFKYLDSSSKINCMNIDEYPPIIEVVGEEILIKNRQLKEVVEKIIFSASTTDEMKQVLKGCLIEIKGNKLKGVALDGFRLAIASVELDKNYESVSVIVPAKSLFDIAKLIENNDEYIKMTLSDKKLMFNLGNTKVITSLIPGEFIRYEHIIPKTYNTTLVTVREQLDQVLGRVSIFSRRDKTSLIKMDIKDSIMTIKAETPQGNIVEKIAISVEGKDIVVGLNANYLIDCVNAIKDEHIKMSITNSTDPCIITPLEGEAYFYLILPIRIMS